MGNFGVYSQTTILGRWAIWMRAQSWSEKTIEERVGIVQHAADQAEVAAEDLTAAEVIAYLGRPGLKAGTRATYHAHLNAWFRFLASNGVREDNPLQDLRRPKARRQEVKALRTAHLRQFLESGIRARTKTMTLLGAYAGFRAGDIASMHGSQVDLISMELEVTGKGGVHAVLPLHPLIAAEAASYPADDWWFPQHVTNRRSGEGGHILANSVTSTIGTAMKRAGINASCHSLRRWYASELLRAGNDLRVIQQLMRHASLATTEGYLIVDEDRRRESVLSLPDLLGVGVLRRVA